MTARDKFGRVLKSPASQELLAELRSIAGSMMKPLRTEHTKGRIVRRQLANGATSERYVMSRGDNSIGLFMVDPKLVRELGALLMRVANGEDAYRLFRQNEKAKRRMGDDHRIGALAYWARFARNPNSRRDRQAAIAAFKRALPSLNNLSEATIKRLAGDHRDWCLSMLSARPYVSFEFTVGKPIAALGEEKIAELREYLDRKSGTTERR